MPARFTFELEPVLEQRRRAEEDHQRRVAAIERERIALEERIRAAQLEIIAARGELRRQLDPSGSAAGPSAGAAVPITDIRLHAAAQGRLIARTQQMVLELAGIHQRLAAARKELLAATTARKAVDLLKTRRYEQWKQEQARREHAELDELAVMRFGRTDATP